MLKTEEMKAKKKKKKGVEVLEDLLTLTFNSKAKLGKVVFAKSGSKLTLPKNPDKPAKNPEITE